MLYVQYMAHSNGYLHIHYFILFCSIIQSTFQELNKKSISKQTIAKKLCIELNWQTCRGM